MRLLSQPLVFGARPSLMATWLSAARQRSESKLLVGSAATPRMTYSWC